MSYDNFMCSRVDFVMLLGNKPVWYDFTRANWGGKSISALKNRIGVKPSFEQRMVVKPPIARGGGLLC